MRVSGCASAFEVGVRHLPHLLLSVVRVDVFVVTHFDAVGSSPVQMHGAGSSLVRWHRVGSLLAHGTKREGTANGKWQMAKMANGKIANGKWQIANGKWQQAGVKMMCCG